MWYKEENIHEEGQESDEKGWDGEDEESEEIARRVSSRSEVRSNCQAKADQSEKGSDWVNNQNGGETASSAGGQLEAFIVGK